MVKKRIRKNNWQGTYHHKINELGQLLCPKCKQWKEASEFNKARNTASGYNHCCRICSRNKETIRLYGITLDDYDKILEKQNGVCAICGSTEVDLKKKRFCIDHDHLTGKVRGILCTSCNTALGSFKDDINLLLRAIEYLNK